MVGNGLLSHAVARILPSALAGLTAGFEMGPGVPPPLISPTNLTHPLLWRVMVVLASLWLRNLMNCTTNRTC